MIPRSFQSPIALGFVLLLAGCSTQGSSADGGETAREAPSLPAAHPPLGAAAAATDSGQSGTVLEVIGASSYTYLRVDTGSGELWLAAPQFSVAVGDRVVWAPGTPMPGWHSDTLDRTWDEVQFISQIQLQGGEPSAPAMPAMPAMPPGHPPVAAASAGAADSVAVEKLEDGQTVAEIHSRAAELSGQRVALRGRVVKANFGIMGSNWLHIQDGSGDAAAGTNDLTVTTQSRASLGDRVVVRGVLATDKDFGAGYRYAVIVADAAVAVEAEARD
jgi:hypothetical protein